MAQRDLEEAWGYIRRAHKTCPHGSLSVALQDLDEQFHALDGIQPSGGAIASNLTLEAALLAADAHLRPQWATLPPRLRADFSDVRNAALCAEILRAACRGYPATRLALRSQA